MLVMDGTRPVPVLQGTQIDPWFVAKFETYENWLVNGLWDITPEEFAECIEFVKNHPIKSAYK